jgi:hypothetical protein
LTLKNQIAADHSFMNGQALCARDRVACGQVAPAAQPLSGHGGLSIGSPGPIMVMTVFTPTRRRGCRLSLLDKPGT